MNKTDKFQWIALCIMFMVIVLLSQCNGSLRSKLRACEDGCEGKETIRIDTIVKADSIPYPVYVDKPIPYKVISPDPNQQKVIDSLIRANKALDALLDYYTTRYYADTLLNDSSAFIAVYDTVSKNAITGRSLMFQNFRPAVIRETRITEKELRFRLFAGGFIGGSKSGQFEAGLSLMAVPKNDNFYVQYSYDAVGNSHRAGLGWKVKFRR